MNKRRLFMLLGLIAFAVLVLANFGRLDDFVGYLRQARWYVLIFIVVMQLVGYYCTARYYQVFTSLFAPKQDIKRLYKMSLALNFVNQAFPSGGASSLPYLSSQMPEVPKGKITLTVFVRYLFTYVSFTAILVAGFLILMLTGNVSALASRLTLIVVLSIIAGSVAAFTIMSNRSWLQAVTSWGLAVVNRFGKTVLRKKRDLVTVAQREKFLDEFSEGYQLLSERHEGRQWSLLWLLGTNLTEVATIYVVFASFGQLVNPGVVIAGYTLANIISVAGVITGGVGLFEATMIATFVALGVPAALATAVVIVYRVLNFAIFLPLGFYFYNRSLAS